MDSRILTEFCGRKVLHFFSYPNEKYYIATVIELKFSFSFHFFPVIICLYMTFFFSNE